MTIDVEKLRGEVREMKDGAVALFAEIDAAGGVDKLDRAEVERFRAAALRLKGEEERIDRQLAEYDELSGEATHDA